MPKHENAQLNDMQSQLLGSMFKESDASKRFNEALERKPVMKFEVRVKIVSSAIKFADGTTIVGKRHGDCFKRWYELNEGKKHYEQGREIQGFITDRLEFKTREEALQICKENNQPMREFSNEKILYSEDLY